MVGGGRLVGAAPETDETAVRLFRSVGGVPPPTLRLPRSERARLAERLIASLDEDTSVEQAWAEEIERHVAGLRSGEVQPIPGEQVFEELKDLFR